jgi:hypothetical protein
MWFSARTAEKDKIIDEKNNQIKLLNEMIILNSQQSISQKNMIDELKKVPQKKNNKKSFT